MAFSDKNQEDKIKVLLSTYKDFSVGTFVSNKRLKEIFTEIFQEGWEKKRKEKEDGRLNSFMEAVRSTCL